jgi:hypothetical protein
MGNSGKKEHLQKVKLALAAKYESLARISGSVVKQRQFLHNADRYRQQAARLAGS